MSSSARSRMDCLSPLEARARRCAWRSWSGTRTKALPGSTRTSVRTGRRRSASTTPRARRQSGRRPRATISPSTASHKSAFSIPISTDEEVQNAWYARTCGARRIARGCGCDPVGCDLARVRRGRAFADGGREGGDGPVPRPRCGQSGRMECRRQRQARHHLHRQPAGRGHGYPLREPVAALRRQPRPDPARGARLRAERRGAAEVCRARVHRVRGRLDQGRAHRSAVAVRGAVPPHARREPLRHPCLWGTPRLDLAPEPRRHVPTLESEGALLSERNEQMSATEEHLPSSHYSRRGFLKRAGAGAGAVALSGGVGAAMAPRAVAARSATVSTSPTTFGRIFPQLPPFAPATDAVRAALADLGKPGGLLDANDDLSKGPVLLITDPSLSTNNRNNPTHTAGTTFVGQFIDHDITFDTTSPLGVPTDPALSPNARTPSLDLDSVYGGGPVASPQLYDP